MLAFNFAESNILKLTYNWCVSFWFSTIIIYGCMQDKMNFSRKQKRLHWKTLGSVHSKGKMREGSDWAGARTAPGLWAVGSIGHVRLELGDDVIKSHTNTSRHWLRGGENNSLKGNHSIIARRRNGFWVKGQKFLLHLIFLFFGIFFF